MKEFGKDFIVGDVFQHPLYLETYNIQVLKYTVMHKCFYISLVEKYRKEEKKNHHL